MITGIHVIAYAPEAEKARAFLRDVLGLRSVDAGHGWLIFGLPPAELGVHPTESGAGAASPEATKAARASRDGARPKTAAEVHDPSGHPRCELYLMCDDVQRTVAELKQKGVEFTSPVIEQDWGLLTMLKMPGAGEIGLYQPKHPTAIASPARA